MTFSGGEEQVRILEIPEIKSWVAKITAHVKNSQDLIRVFLLIDACRRIESCYSITLELPYLPYSRQDRVCYPGEAFSLSWMLNSLRTSVDRLITWDIHSKPEEPWFITNIPAHHWVSKIRSPTDWIVSPDKGAVERASECCPNKSMLVQCDKERDPDTGYLSKVVIRKHIGQGNFHSNADLLIVDDICDGGRTFINLAKELRKHTAGKIKLYVTHGIFSQGLDPLLEHIDHIYTANCMWHPELADSRYLTVIEK